MDDRQDFVEAFKGYWSDPSVDALAALLALPGRPLTRAVAAPAWARDAGSVANLGKRLE